MNVESNIITESKSVKWTRFNLEEVKLELDIFSDMSALSVRKDGDLMSLIQDFGPVRIILWAGPDRTLDFWRKHLDIHHMARFEEETVVEVCGNPGRKQTATVAETGAVGSYISTDGDIGHTYVEPSECVHVCVSFIHSDQNILQCWSVDKHLRSDYAECEDRFFSSVRCY